MADAVVVVTNHAFLSRHADTLPFKRPFLVVDEAQHFADNTAAAFARRVALDHLNHQLHRVWQLSEPDERHSLTAVYQSEPAMLTVLQQLNQQAATAETAVNTLQRQIHRHFFLAKQLQLQVL